MLFPVQPPLLGEEFSHAVITSTYIHTQKYITVYIARRAFVRLSKLEQRGLEKFAPSSMLWQEELTPESRDGGSDAPFTSLPRFSAKCGPCRVTSRCSRVTRRTRPCHV